MMSYKERNTLQLPPIICRPALDAGSRAELAGYDVVAINVFSGPRVKHGATTLEEYRLLFSFQENNEQEV